MATLGAPLVYLLGAALLAALVRWWQPRVTWWAAAGHSAAAALFFAVPLFTADLQLPTDLVYRLRPWSEAAVTASGPDRLGNDLLSDIPLQMLPFRGLVRERLRHGAAPLWANELATGEPLLGNAQSAPFAPLHLITLALPLEKALSVAVALQIVLAQLLMHALLAALGAGRAGAAFGALAFAFSTYLICWAYHPIGMAAVWLPGVFLGLLLLRRGERGGLSGLVACATGLALTGHPETIAHTSLACLLVAAALVAVGKSAQGTSRARFLSRLGLAGVLCACFAAPVLLPVAQVIPGSVRRAALKSFPQGVWPPPFELAQAGNLLDPLLFGSPRDGNWLGPANFNELCSGYAGVLTLTLALAGAAVLRGRIALILAGGVAALLAALRLPPFFELVGAVPGLEHAAQGRLRLFWVLALALAAGLSLEPLLALRPPGRWLALALIASGLALAFLPPPDSPWQRAWWLAALAGEGVLAALLLLAARAPGRRPAWQPWIAVAALAVELGLLGVRFHPTVPAAYDLAPPPALVWLMARQRERPGEPFRVLAEGGDLAPNLPALYGLWHPLGNDPMQPAGAARLVGLGLRPHYRPGRRLQLSVQALRAPRAAALLDYVAVRYLLLGHHQKPPPPWEPVWDGPGGRIWRNPDALPLFFMPARALPVSDPREAQLRAGALEDFAALATVEDGPAVPGGPRPATGTVAVRRVRPNGFDLQVSSETGGLVASSVSFAPGWRLRLDGRALPAQRVNGGFVGFTVPAGTHQAALDYLPGGWLLGRWLAALGLALAAAEAWRLRRNRVGRLVTRLPR